MNKKWFALGLNDSYENGQIINGKPVVLNFKNVAITDNEEIDKSSFVIWDRVWEKSEAEDVKRIKAILRAVEFL